MLLHELYHHRQVEARHWYCPEAMEWDAYRVQAGFLGALGEDGGFDWVRLALISSCTPGDHHPD